jgi:hypothetical protein
MSKKHNVSGRRLKSISDPTLSLYHPKGTTVSLIQPAIDNIWGRYYFKDYFRSYLFFKIAKIHYKKMITLLTECRKQPIGKDNSRSISDNLRDKLEVESIEFIIFIKLGFEYIIPDMMRSVNNIRERKFNIQKINWENISSLEDKLKILVKCLGISTSIPNSLSDLFNRRDIIEHPTEDRIYNSLGNGWKNVHLSWILSGEIEKSYEDINTFIIVLKKSYDKYIQNNPIPGVLNVTRGIRAVDPSKKYKENNHTKL